ncbi:MAG: type II toxin-antitoxin system PemK/MazF family toxin [Treponema sp.]|nr:type II toxin-antitoxin system PemK/MazF family toxin [Treponema sp.]
MIRGELWWVDLGVPFGSGSGFRRPVVILQNDFFNKSQIKTTIILPLSTNMILADAPGNIIITKKESKLNKNSVIILSQVKAVDRARLIEKISKIDRTIMEKIENNIMFILGINRI